MLTIGENILQDGKPIQIISGSIHYFRVMPEYWRDRLEKLRNMGCNTVETYIPWNFHEPKRGEFLWNGMHDIVRFMDIATELGLYIIIRPSPYICAEWEFGGLPAWLLREKDLHIRCMNRAYLDAVRSYYSQLIPRLAPYQTGLGGNMIMVQVENEYGSFGNDKEYLQTLVDMMREFGLTKVPFVTSDGPEDRMLVSGTLRDQAFATCNFGSHVKEQFAVMDEKLGSETPKMIMEYWCGWFDAWGNGGHKGSDLAVNQKDLKDVLALGGHINFYMFHGGTNFGFMNGSNYYDHLTPDVTSYDYDAILAEDGQITPKYEALQEIIRQHKEITDSPLTTVISRRTYGSLKVRRRTGLFENLRNLAEPVHSAYPQSMEELGQNTGYVLYRAELREPQGVETIQLYGANDRIKAYADGAPLFTLFDLENNNKQCYEPVKMIGQLDLLVENMGRVNYGMHMSHQKKGICDGVCVNGHWHFGYDQYTLPLDEDQLAKIDFEAGFTPFAPAFHEFVLQVEGAPEDTFVDFAGFGKGCVFVNGFNLGRYWEIGPQKRLYLPAPLLHEGENMILLFETEGKYADEITLMDAPDLG